MIYIISIRENIREGNTSYMAIDTYSDSAMEISSQILKNIIMYTKIQVVNASIQNDAIIIKKWANKLSTYTGGGMTGTHSGTTHVLLATKEDAMYKIVDQHGKVSNIWRKDLRKLVAHENVANCNDKMEATDTYEIVRDTEFVRCTEEKYKIFVAKSALLGLGDSNFEYDIENYDVRLTKYTGSGENIILPSFITSIGQRAFYNTNIKTIKLNEGLKTIGTRAFEAKQHFGLLDRIEIPESVELICNKVFINNQKIVKPDGELHDDRFKLRNNKTIILSQSIYSG